MLLGFSTNSFSQNENINSTLDSSIINLIIDFGKTYEGTPYKYGSCHSLSGGFDCSGFINYIFKMAGYDLPRSSKDLFGLGTESDLSNLKKGDLVFFNTLNRGVVSHVGIVSEIDKEKVIMLHVSSSKGVQEIDIISSDYWYSRFVLAKSL